MHSICTSALQVTVNPVKSFSVGQKCFMPNLVARQQQNILRSASKFSRYFCRTSSTVFRESLQYFTDTHPVGAELILVERTDRRT